MLRITRMVGDDSGEILKLEGKLQGPWVDEAHDAHALSAAQASRICLDLSGLTFTDGEGAALLCGFWKIMPAQEIPCRVCRGISSQLEGSVV
jgi:anti-anti-sigma regulatory factor